jgi:chain length determinant protein tyrosine kinase EpsG
MNTVPHANTLEQTMELPNTKHNTEPLRAVGKATGNDTIGRLLVDAGKIKAQDVDRVLKLKQEQNIRFGEAAIKLGLIKEADVQKVLAQQFDYAYLTPGQGKFSADLVAAYQPFSEQAEALRALRNQLKLRWFGTGHKTLAVAGVSGGEGASFLVANLAVAFAQLGVKTLLIDADMRSPRQHEIFGLGQQLGLSDMLAGRTDRSALSGVQTFDTLTVLPAGSPAPNPAELLAGAAFPRLLESLAAGYDVVLVDTPPAQAALDYQIIAACVGGVLMATRRDHTRLEAVANMKDMVATAGAEVVGAFVNIF